MAVNFSQVRKKSEPRCLGSIYSIGWTPWFSLLGLVVDWLVKWPGRGRPRTQTATCFRDWTKAQLAPREVCTDVTWGTKPRIQMVWFVSMAFHFILPMHFFFPHFWLIELSLENSREKRPSLCYFQPSICFLVIAARIKRSCHGAAVHLHTTDLDPVSLPGWL